MRQDLVENSSSEQNRDAHPIILNLTISGRRSHLVVLLEEMARVEGFSVIDGSFTTCKPAPPATMEKSFLSF